MVLAESSGGGEVTEELLLIRALERACAVEGRSWPSFPDYYQTVAHEIERKFLVASDAWRSGGGEGTLYRQGYLLNSEGRTVRVRLSERGAWLTVKGARVGLTRPEFEYRIPVGDAEEMLALCEGALIEKTRYRVPYGAHVWEVDEFHGDNAGLVLAEIELGHEAETFERPGWLGEEVSDDPRYYSGYLANEPFSSWGQHSD